MQMVKKAAGYIFFVLFLILVLMPKQELYYKLEQELSKNDIVISNETLKEGWFSLNVENASVYIKGIKIATIEEADIFTMFFYTGVTLENVKLDESMKSLFLDKIEDISLSYGVIHPYKLKFSLEGEFGEAWGNIDLETKKLVVIFTKVDKLGTVKRQFKKVEEGWQYETSF